MESIDGRTPGLGLGEEDFQSDLQYITWDRARKPVSDSVGGFANV